MAGVKKTVGHNIKNKKKSTNGVGKKSTANNQKVNSEDIRRIEALEATISEMETNIFGLRQSLNEVFKLGIDRDKIKSIFSTAIEGEVTEQKNGRIIGWAKNLVEQTTSQTVSVYYQDKFLAMSIANKKIKGQENIKNAYGNGFNMILPKQFYDGKSRKLSFRVGDYGVDIPSLLKSVVFEEKFPLEGEIKSNKNGIIKGWVLDNGDINAPVVVSIYYGKEQVAKTLADLKEISLSSKLGKTNCYHGFEIEIPARFGDGKIRNFRVVISPWNYGIIDGVFECVFTKK